ncbi:MAG TPA: hypothetical protein VGL94_16170 [Ktedonobacteraceae bacterium]
MALGSPSEKGKRRDELHRSRRDTTFEGRVTVQARKHCQGCGIEPASHSLPPVDLDAVGCQRMTGTPEHIHHP